MLSFWGEVFSFDVSESLLWLVKANLNFALLQLSKHIGLDLSKILVEWRLSGDRSFHSVLVGKVVRSRWMGHWLQ